MFFGSLPVGQALGATLVHSLKLANGSFKKGRELTAVDLALLQQAGIKQIDVVRFMEDDVQEDVAAYDLAWALAGSGLTVAEPFTGRCNLFAEAAGIVCIDAGRLHALNRINADLTVSSLPPFARVAAKDMVATIKIIPFATNRQALTDCLAVADDDPLIKVAPFNGIRVRLIQSRTSATSDKLLDKTVQVTRSRVEGVGGALLGERRCSHTAGGISRSVRATLNEGADIILIAGASAVTDRRDVLPAGIEAAGGRVDHLGMPVDPGNLLVFGRHGNTPVIGLPGCARSPKLNGFDWVLERLAARLPVTPDDIMAMGVGGLLSEISSRPQPRSASADVITSRAPRIMALVLAAGRSSRMGRNNKLLIDLDGRPLVRHVVDAALASQCESVSVVTGHMHSQVIEALAGTRIAFVHNSDFATGLASSLRVGLAAVQDDVDGVVVLLGDMPKIDARLLNRMIAAFSPADHRSIVVPVAHGKRGNPVLWSASFIDPMRRLQGDSGAKALIGENEAEVVEIQADDDAPLIDLDTPEALAAFRETRT